MIRKYMKRCVNTVLGAFGFEVVRKIKKIHQTPAHFIDIDADSDFKGIYEKSQPYTMTGKEKMYAMYTATKYVVENDIAGDIVECGAYRGGSLMVSALTLTGMGCTDRKIYAYDTYEGMSAPTAIDINVNGLKAVEYFNETKQDDQTSPWCYASLEETTRNLRSTGYPPENLLLVKGKVEDTIPQTVPGRISLLRLDSDWYESTLHELDHLFPLLSPGGVLIIDDYGHWGGQKKAVDEYLARHHVPLLLTRIEYSGRIGVKR
jgi:hypothetical protein